MGARRKADTTAQAFDPAQPLPSPRGAGASLALANAGGAGGASSPVHDHIARLEASFAGEAHTEPFSPAVRMAIMVGAPTVLWALVIMGVSAVARAVGA